MNKTDKKRQFKKQIQKRQFKKQIKKNLSHPLRTKPFPVDPFTMSRMCYQSILTYLTNDGLIVSYTPTSLVSETCKMFLQYLRLTKK